MQQQPPSSSNGPPLPVNISYVVVFFLERDKWKQRILFVDWEKFSIRFLKWDSGKEQYSKFEIPVFELYSVVAGVDREILIYTTNGSVHPLRSKYEHEHGFLFKQLKDLNDFRNESASGALHWGAIQQRWMRMQRELTCNARQAGLVKRAFLTGDQKKKGRSNAWVVIARNRVLFYKAKKAGFPSHVVTLDEKFRLTGSQEDSEVVASSDYGSIPSEFVNHRANQEEHEEMAAETCQFSMKCYDYSHYMSWVQALVTTMKGSSEEGEENKASEERRPVEPAPKRGADTPASAASNQQGSAAAHAQPGEAKARPPAKIPSAAGSTPTTSRQMVSRQQASPAPVPSPRIPNFQAVAPTPPPPAYSNAGYSLMPTQQSALEPRRLAQTFETPGSSALSTSYPAMPTYSSLTPNLSPIKKRAVPASPPLPPLALLRKLKGNKAGRIYETSCTIGVQTDLQDPGPMLVEEPETPRSEEKIEDFLSPEEETEETEATASAHPPESPAVVPAEGRNPSSSSSSATRANEAVMQPATAAPARNPHRAARSSTDVMMDNKNKFFAALGKTIAQRKAQLKKKAPAQKEESDASAPPPPGPGDMVSELERALRRRKQTIGC